MATKVKGNWIKFKPYDQYQKLNIDIVLDKAVPEGSLPRIVNSVVERVSIDALECYYAGGGSSSYHPKMMLKIWIYGYIERIYTSRKLSKALKENICLMFLSGGQTPCFKTLNSFRSDMSDMLELVFKEVLWILLEEKFIVLEDLYVDGTKMEANANKFKVTWRKNVERYKGWVMERLDELMKQIDEMNEEEDVRYGDNDLKCQDDEAGVKTVEGVMSSEVVKTSLAKLEEGVNRLSQEDRRDKEGKSILKRMKRTQTKVLQELAILEKYERQESVLNGRNSYSHTDMEATALRMKDDQLLPGYNVQIMTNNQYILNYSIHQEAGDVTTLPSHLERMKERHSGFPIPDERNLCADSGYGSEENYVFMEDNHMNGFVKYPSFYQEQTGELAKKKFNSQNWTFDKEGDFYKCPNNKPLPFMEERQEKTKNGYKKTLRIYRCESCADCPFAAECKKPEVAGRSVQVSPKGEALKAGAKERLETEKGWEMRKQRGVEVETPFGDIKYNMGRERFVLRGVKKVGIEFGLISIAHNLRKVYCKKSGVWEAYYAQRRAKKVKRA